MQGKLRYLHMISISRSTCTGIQGRRSRGRGGNRAHRRTLIDPDHGGLNAFLESACSISVARLSLISSKISLSNCLIVSNFSWRDNFICDTFEISGNSLASIVSISFNIWVAEPLCPRLEPSFWPDLPSIRFWITSQRYCMEVGVTIDVAISRLTKLRTSTNQLSFQLTILALFEHCNSLNGKFENLNSFLIRRT